MKKQDKKPELLKDLIFAGDLETIKKAFEGMSFNNCTITIYIADKINFGTIYKGSTHNEVEKDKQITKE